MADLTVKILENIRDEIRGVRAEHGALLRSLQGQVGKNTELLQEHSGLLQEHSGQLREIHLSVRGIAAYKERDTILLADELEAVKRRVGVCEQRLGIPDA